MKTKEKITDFNSYIYGFPRPTQVLLIQLRAAIIKAAPEAEELISYQMPAFKYKGVLVYIAAYKNHLGFYPTASGIETFKKQIAGFKNSKGAVQFPLDQPLPLQLITKIVKFKVKENSEKAKLKLKK